MSVGGANCRRTLGAVDEAACRLNEERASRRDRRCGAPSPGRDRRVYHLDRRSGPEVRLAERKKGARLARGVGMAKPGRDRRWFGGVRRWVWRSVEGLDRRSAQEVHRWPAKQGPKPSVLDTHLLARLRRDHVLLAPLRFGAKGRPISLLYGGRSSWNYLLEWHARLLGVPFRFPRSSQRRPRLDPFLLARNGG
jgi:hypothetical protein